MKKILNTALIGIVATATVDAFTFLVSLFTHKSHGIQYIGRWIAYLFKGQYWHNTIKETPSVSNELLIGWMSHYTIGIAFAFSLVLFFGNKWLIKPTLLPALIISNITLLFPICIVQPALGFGIAFSNLPHPAFLLLKIISIHAVYGIGLFWAATCLKYVQRK